MRKNLHDNIIKLLFHFWNNGKLQQDNKEQEDQCSKVKGQVEQVQVLLEVIQVKGTENAGDHLQTLKLHQNTT